MAKEAAKKKTAKQLERYFKGAANHRRIQILRLISQNPGMTMEGIAKTLDVNIKTISAHTKRLVEAGLMNKRYRAQMVEHTLSPYGERFIRFINSF